MAKTPIIVRFLIALLLMSSFGAAPAAERTLFTIESSPEGLEMKVLDEPGGHFAEQPGSAPAWRLRAGDAVALKSQPPDRVVDLYTGTPHAPSLLGRVIVRYYPGAKGWLAHFRLEEEPLVARINGRWQPLDPARGVTGLVRIGNTLPNAEGFFPTLEFGLGGGTLAIVAWQIR